MPETQGNNVCSNCHQTFEKLATLKNGKESKYCQKCYDMQCEREKRRPKRNRDWTAEIKSNPERKEHKEQWKKENHEKIIEYNKKYHAKMKGDNPETIIIYKYQLNNHIHNNTEEPTMIDTEVSNTSDDVQIVEEEPQQKEIVKENETNVKEDIVREKNRIVKRNQGQKEREKLGDEAYREKERLRKREQLRKQREKLGDEAFREKERIRKAIQRGTMDKDGNKIVKPRKSKETK